MTVRTKAIMIRLTEPEHAALEKARLSSAEHWLRTAEWVRRKLLFEVVRKSVIAPVKPASKVRR